MNIIKIFTDIVILVVIAIVIIFVRVIDIDKNYDHNDDLRKFTTHLPLLLFLPFDRPAVPRYSAINRCDKMM